jgi:CRISPR-associated protein Csm4
MDTYAIYLKPKGSFVSPIHSDTLFGAICWAIRVIYGAGPLEEILAAFNGHPKFVPSSAFPYLRRGDQLVRFFPKPQLPELRSGVVEDLAKAKSKTDDTSSLAFKQAVLTIVEKLKDLKNASYVSESLFQEIILGQTDMKSLYHRLKGRGSVTQDIEKLGSVLITMGGREPIDPDGELRTVLREADVQRNQIDRVAGSTVEGLLFFDKQTFLRRDVTGMWFILRTDELDLLKPALRYLEDTGIGGERAVGKGHFEIPLGEIEQISLPEADTPNSYVSLSRYLPRDAECDFTGSPLSYTVVNFRGKHESRFPVPDQPIYKDLVRVLAEGSIFPLRERKAFYGKIERVGNLADRIVWQNGVALPVFAKIGGQ